MFVTATSARHLRRSVSVFSQQLRFASTAAPTTSTFDLNQKMPEFKHKIMLLGAPGVGTCLFISY
jgi:hypothetical protein